MRFADRERRGKTMQGVTGDYQVQRTPGWGGGSDGLAETHGGDEARYYECKVAGDADARGDTDLSGYDITENKVKFTINEDDKNERSRVMSDRTDPKLENIANWKAEAKEFETALADALGIGPSKMP
jgi:hypothetical protein